MTKLLFHQLWPRAAQMDTFNEFPTSLRSVGNTSDDGTISISTKDGVTVHKEEDVLITCKGALILIGAQDQHGHYRIPLVQQHGQWQPCKPSEKARKARHEANSIYNLPFTEQAIKWMHAMYNYPVRSTCLKAI